MSRKDRPVEYAVQNIIDCLNARKVKATYGAVAGILGCIPQDVGRCLGERRREASWIVNKETGKPTGYDCSQIHKDVCDAKMIADSEELKKLLDEHSHISN